MSTQTSFLPFLFKITLNVLNCSPWTEQKHSHVPFVFLFRVQQKVKSNYPNFLKPSYQCLTFKNKNSGCLSLTKSCCVVWCLFFLNTSGCKCIAGLLDHSVVRKQNMVSLDFCLERLTSRNLTSLQTLFKHCILPSPKQLLLCCWKLSCFIGTAFN